MLRMTHAYVSWRGETGGASEGLTTFQLARSGFTVYCFGKLGSFEAAKPSGIDGRV